MEASKISTHEMMPVWVFIIAVIYVCIFACCIGVSIGYIIGVDGGNATLVSVTSSTNVQPSITLSPTPLSTSTFVPTPVVSVTPSNTNTPTFTSTITDTLTLTLTPSITDTPSQTFTPSKTNTLTPTYTLTKTSTLTRTLPPIKGIGCLPDNDRVSAIVTRVIDGDTIEVGIGGQVFTVRYIGIDAPEFTTTREYYGSQATKLNQKMVEGKYIILVKDSSETDRYNRLLRYVIVGNKFVNYELVRQGAATASDYPPDSSCSLVFSQAMFDAQNESLGMWRPTPIPAATSSGGGGLCNCSIDYDCKDFATHAQAQSCFNSCGGSPSYNWARLDADHDGLACEALP